MGFRPLVSLQSTIQATGPLALTLASLTPAEDASLRWTHTDICSPVRSSEVLICVGIKWIWGPARTGDIIYLNSRECIRGKNDLNGPGEKRYLHSDEHSAFFGQLLSNLVRFDQGAQPFEDLQGLH